MDIFMDNVPEQLSETQLQGFLRQYVTSIGPQAFQVRKMKNRSIAFLTIADVAAANQFLVNFSGGKAPRIQGRMLRISKAHKPPDPRLLDALRRKDEETKLQKSAEPARNENLVKKFPFVSLECGLWEASKAEIVFHSYYQDVREGQLILESTGLKVLLFPSKTHDEAHLFDVHYRCIDYIALGDDNSPHVTLTLQEAPQISLRHLDKFSEMIRAMSLNQTPPTPPENNKKRPLLSRVPSLHASHNVVAGCCLVYKIVLQNSPALKDFHRTLQLGHGYPPFTRWLYSKFTDQISFPNQLHRMSRDLAQEHRGVTAPGAAPFKLPYLVQFQLQRLVYNGILSPRKTRKLCSHVSVLLTRLSPIAVAEGIRKVARSIRIPEPHLDPVAYSTRRYLLSIEDNAAAWKPTGTAYGIAERHEHLGMIHRVNITPTGMYLEGPELETKNRVLRQFPDYLDHFIRVSFVDENYQKLMGSRHTSLGLIHHNRFKEILQKGIVLGDRTFIFLGFSNSSLHTYQCWFMAPFYDGQLQNAERIIQSLGDFSVFRSPARCAARIGQTFSDATDTVTIDKSFLFDLAEVERPDDTGVKRTFSDGVGTISEDLLKEVWKEFRKAKKERATLLQIRFQGAKGMLSLDSRLKGKKLGLRPSMVKFYKSPSFELEICGAAYKPLPMYLNRQYIKILEDLGVPAQAFLDLQRKAVDNIREVMISPVNAATFLEENFVSTSARMPEFIRCLWRIGHNFRDDDFLRDVVEMAAFYRLREIKYRGRIPVPNAFTLYGVVDETGILGRGEVYAATRDQHGQRHVLTGRIPITRAPALHPGDIQYANAVDVPEDSVLNNLHNCIVFSQHGSRDLPSMLSGGDLDGDVYSIILDKSLWPKGTYTAADYERPTQLDIGRQVEKNDIVNFFIQFMESDQLGRIANAHVQVADQKENGTLSTECLTLAEMHSTAVDFAKTGIPVDLRRFPRTYKKDLKPDFMATAPRMLLGAHNKLKLEDAIKLHEAESSNDIFGLNLEDWKPKFYVSDKVLGQLYRDIDEERIHEEIRQTQILSQLGAESPWLMNEVYNHILPQVQDIEWREYQAEAREIKSRYENNLVDTAYQFSASSRQPLAELEVFTGMVLGREGGMLDRRTRDRSISMKDLFNQNVAFTINWILRGDPGNANPTALNSNTNDEENLGEEDEEEEDSQGLERAFACLDVAMNEETQVYARFGTPRSFKYIAAGVCLKQLEKQRTQRINAILYGRKKSRYF